MNIELLDINNPAEVLLYERALFRAFSGINDPTLDDIWTTNRREKRITTTIPYESQLIYCAKTPAPQILGSFALNINFTQPLQLEMLGFTIDKLPGRQAEVLQIFTLALMALDRPLLKVLTEHVFKNLKKHAIEYVFATCPIKRLRFYEEAGLTLLDKKNIRGNTECLIGIDLINPK